MEEVIYYNNLYDLYSSLLTDKQKQYFEDYYFQNLSFSEMAENYQVSRNAVFKQIHITVQKLEEFEDKLHLLKKKNQLLEISKSISDSSIAEVLENMF